MGDVRGRGLMVGIELVADRETRLNFDAERRIGQRICQRAIQRGVWIRPLGDVVVLMPPLVASDEELDLLAEVVVESIRDEFAESQEPLIASE